ncbi:MAG: OsmC family peroxiredoxin [Alphaproteobacteria bacterium]|nr:MAG: OsmC family peroxiredoxin [Alphaproteobacteria bacterium]
MGPRHRYEATLTWTGAESGPVRDYGGYSRAYRIDIAGKPPLVGSADAAFRGDPAVHNPEDLLLAAISACHMLTYLALCARGGIEVVAYSDRAEGTMVQEGGGGRFIEAVLRPRVTLAPGSDAARAEALHATAHRDCFIAASLNFPVRTEARTTVQPEQPA